MYYHFNIVTQKKRKSYITCKKNGRKLHNVSFDIILTEIQS
jgi:hypothetical protein